MTGALALIGTTWLVLMLTLALVVAAPVVGTLVLAAEMTAVGKVALS